MSVCLSVGVSLTHSHTLSVSLSLPPPSFTHSHFILCSEHFNYPQIFSGVRGKKTIHELGEKTWDENYGVSTLIVGVISVEVVTEKQSEWNRLYSHIEAPAKFGRLNVPGLATTSSSSPSEQRCRCPWSSWTSSTSSLRRNVRSFDPRRRSLESRSNTWPRSGP